MKDRRVEPIDAELGALIARTRGLDLAPADLQARVLAGVETIVVGPGAGGGAAGGAAAGAGAMRWPGWTRRFLAHATTFTMGAAAGVFASHEIARMRSDASHESTAPLPMAAQAPAAPGESAQAPVQPAPAVDEALPPPTQATKTGPAASKGAAPGPSAEPRAHASTIAEERLLLDTARAALEQEDGASALAATKEHERRFPSGVLLQEREAIGIRALLMTGDTEGARAREARFRERFPDSMLLPALDSLFRPASPPPP